MIRPTPAAPGVPTDLSSILAKLTFMLASLPGPTERRPLVLRHRHLDRLTPAHGDRAGPKLTAGRAAGFTFSLL
jgi:hypothetical protein